MLMRDFIAENREELVSSIMGVLNRGRESNPMQVTIDDDEIENWIANDEGLWNWAISEGVDVYGDDEEE